MTDLFPVAAIVAVTCTLSSFFAWLFTVTGDFDRWLLARDLDWLLLRDGAGDHRLPDTVVQVAP